MVTGDPPPEGAGVSLKSADAEPGPEIRGQWGVSIGEIIP